MARVTEVPALAVGPQHLFETVEVRLANGDRYGGQLVGYVRGTTSVEISLSNGQTAPRRVNAVDGDIVAIRDDAVPAVRGWGS